MFYIISFMAITIMFLINPFLGLIGMMALLVFVFMLRFITKPWFKQLFMKNKKLKN